MNIELIVLKKNAGKIEKKNGAIKKIERKKKENKIKMQQYKKKKKTAIKNKCSLPET